MLELSAEQQQQFSAAVEAVAGRADVRLAVGAIHDDLAGGIAQRKPICRGSGRCCKFEEYGHRLFVTTAEMGVFVGTLGTVGYALEERSQPDRKRSVRLPTYSQYPAKDGSCPFQRDSLCTVHSIRPFGCRVFFCDETAADWQVEQYERFHGRIRKLHDDLSIPYFYVEWRQALAAIEPGVRQRITL